MHDRIVRFIIIALLALVAGVPVVLSMFMDRGETHDQTLIIMTPHNEQIRYEFARAFNAWRRQRGEAPVEFRWITTGGTSDLVMQLESVMTAAARRGTLDRGEYDLFFGGGAFEHNRLSRGIDVNIGGERQRIRIVGVPDLGGDGQDTEAFLAETFPVSELGGEPLYVYEPTDPDDPETGRAWFGAALSSFGIVYNRHALDWVGMTEHPPRTWRDLAAPEYYTWVALADPGHSGSIRATYNTILRHKGWEEGWQVLRRAFANARYFTDSAGKVPTDVSHGQAAVGMCIDFYGRYQLTAVGQERVGYVDPAGLTSITADPITLLRGAPNRELAEQFIRFVLSHRGQALLQRRRGQEHGPHRYELRRMPIRYDMYYKPQAPGRIDIDVDPVNEAEKQHWADSEVDPWAIARPVPDGMPDWFGPVATIAHAMALDVHADLQRAWRAIMTERNPQVRAQMLELFDAMPPRLTLAWDDEGLARNWRDILDDPDHPRREEVVDELDALRRRVTDGWPELTDDDRIEWTRFFRNNYRQIVRMRSR